MTKWQNCTLDTVSILVIIFLVSIATSVARPTMASEAADPATITDSDFCLLQQCVTQGQLAAAGMVVAATTAGAATVAYAYGPEAAIAAAGGFLLFGHFLFDALPIAVAGAAAWYYGPQAWTWIGFDIDRPSAEPLK